MNSQDANPQSSGLFSRESTILGSTGSDSAPQPKLDPESDLEWQRVQAEQQAQQQAVRKAEKFAYNALAQREYSSQELEEKLLRKNTPVDIVKIVLRQVRELDLQSDERFTESFVRSRISRGQGPVRIEMELKQRGISTDLVDQHLAAEESFWLAQAKAQLARRGVGSSAGTESTAAQTGELDLHSEPELEHHEAGSADGVDAAQQYQQRQKERASHARFLASRGFRSNTIARALEDALD